MNQDDYIIHFKNLSFFYVNPDAPAEPEKLGADDISIIFNELDLSLPPGVLSIIGENGIGKSTLMMLAAGRLFPVKGSVSIFGQDSSRWRKAAEDPALELERIRLVSVVYQNMEFETESSLGPMLEGIFSSGLHDSSHDWVLEESRKVLQLDELLDRRFQQLSKGEMQRALIAMAIAYGSNLTVMDEPVFAMEDRQKEQALEYLQDYAHRTLRSIYFSAHNIHLCRDYADNTLLMRKDGNFILGSSKEVCKPEQLEAAYQVPMDFLHRKEQLYRDMLLKGRRAQADG